MTIDELYKLLNQLNLPLAYNHFKNPQKPPYLVYMTDDSSNFAADNKVYHKTDNFAIELYTDKKGIKLETQLELLLDAHDLYYEKYEVYIDTEKLYQVRYEI